MAANPFEGVYDNGAVVFNTTPFLQLSMQMQARKQAKQQALDEYYQDLSKNLTPAGMASNDVPDFMNKVNAWRDYVVQNRKILDNPNSKEYAQAASQAGYLYNDAMQHAGTSKQKVKDLSQFNQLRLSHPDYTITDAGMQSANDAGLPISQGYKPLDWGTVEYNPKNKPTTVDDWNKWREYGTKGLEMTPGQPTTVTDPKTKSKYVSQRFAYNNDALNEIARRYEDLYSRNQQFKNEVDALAQDEGKYRELNSRFKQIYGHDLDIKHPEEFATALMMPQIEKFENKEKAFSPTIINLPKEDKEEKNAQNIGASIDNYIDQLKANSTPVQYKYKGSTTPEIHYQVQPNSDLKDALSIGSGSSKRMPEQIQFLPNGDIKPIFYKTVKNKAGDYEYATDGKGHYAVDSELSQPINANEFRIRVAKTLLGQTGTKAEMQLQAKKPQQAATKSGSEYTNITQTNKGTIGLKNGKWYDIKTGKPIE